MAHQSESGYTVDSRWITYTHRAARPCHANKAFRPCFAPGSPSDARMVALRSMPQYRPGSTVTFEIDKTNYVLTSPTTLQIAGRWGEHRW